jgi:hypothetical protein
LSVQSVGNLGSNPSDPTKNPIIPYLRNKVGMVGHLCKQCRKGQFLF